MFQYNSLNRSIALAFSTILAVSALSGCGGSSDDRKTPTTQPDDEHDHGDEHNHGDEDIHGDEDGHNHGDEDEESSVTAEFKQGRLLIAEKDSNKAYVYSLAQNKVIQTLDLTGKADALQTSPDGHYALGAV